MCATRFLTIWIVMFEIMGVDTANITHAEQLYKDMFEGYNRRLFPVLNQSVSVNIDMQVAIYSLNKFDEISGELQLTTAFYMYWKEERVVWDPNDYGGIQSLLVHVTDIWKPQLYILQSFDTIQEVGNTSLQPRIKYNGSVSWTPGMILKVSCSVDVTYFPFDIQICSFLVSGWAYNADEVYINIKNNTIDTSFYSQNSQWDLTNTTIISYQLVSNEFPPTVILQITLARRYSFFLVYIIVPVIFLGLINNLVFAMPSTSGERTSVAVTIFLSFVVYLEMINNTVPESSSPVAYMYYYIMFLLVYSSVILFLCVISLRIHNKDTTVPSTVQTCVIYLRFWCRKRRRQVSKISPTDSHDKDLNSDRISIREKIVPDRLMSIHENPEVAAYVQEQNETDRDECPEITWTEVGKTYDRYCFMILYLIFCVVSVQTFVSLANNIGL